MLCTPIGSVGTAALPVCDTIACTSGKPRSPFPTSVTVRSEASRLMLAGLVEVTTMAPSLGCGMNSPPSRVLKNTDTANSAAASPAVSQGCPIARRSTGV